MRTIWVPATLMLAVAGCQTSDERDLWFETELESSAFRYSQDQNALRACSLHAWLEFALRGRASPEIMSDKGSEACHELYEHDANLDNACLELVRTYVKRRIDASQARATRAADGQAARNNRLLLRCGAMGRSPDFVTGVCR